MEEQGETDFFSIYDGKNDFSLLFVKNLFFQGCLICNHLIKHVLIICKRSDKGKDQSSVFSTGISET